MNRVTTVSTFLGLLGLIVAMLAALGNAPALVVALGFAMMTMGIIGAVIGAATMLSRAWQSAR